MYLDLLITSLTEEEETKQFEQLKVYFLFTMLGLSQFCNNNFTVFQRFTTLPSLPAMFEYTTAADVKYIEAVKGSCSENYSPQLERKPRKDLWHHWRK